MTKEVIEVPFEGVAVRKLHDLFERGYTVCGVAIQRTTQNSNFDRGAITTGGMVMWWRPEQHKSELHRLHEENQTLREKNGLLKYALTECESLKAENAKLEAMLDAVGAGGVGQSIKPQIQADTAPAAWAIYSDDGTAIRLWSRYKAFAQERADKLGLPLVALYAAPQPAAQSCCTCTKTADLHKAPAPAQQPVAILDIRRSKRTGELESWGFAEKPNDAESGTYAVYAAPKLPVQEPFGYFKATPFGWTDCDKADEGAVALYEAPQPANQPLTNGQIAEIEREACAALCDDIVQEEEGKPDRDYSREDTAQELAVLIRARGQQ